MLVLNMRIIMIYRVSATIAYINESTSIYESVLDFGGTRTSSIPSEDLRNFSQEELELLSWPEFRTAINITDNEVCPIISPINIDHIRDIVFTVVTIEDNGDSSSITNDGAFGVADGVKDNTLLSDDLLCSPLKELKLFYEFDGPNNSLSGASNSSVSELSAQRSGHSYSRSCTITNNRLKIDNPTPSAHFRFPLITRSLNLQELNITKGIGFSCDIENFSGSGGQFRVGFEPTAFKNRGFYINIVQSIPRMDIIYANSFDGIGSGTSLGPVMSALPTNFKISGYWDINGMILIAIDGVVIRTFDAGENYMLGPTNTEINMLISAFNDVEADIKNFKVLDSNSITELDNFISAPTPTLGPPVGNVPDMTIIISGLSGANTIFGKGNGIHIIPFQNVHLGNREYFRLDAGSNNSFIRFSATTFFSSFSMSTYDPDNLSGHTFGGVFTITESANNSSLFGSNYDSYDFNVTLDLCDGKVKDRLFGTITFSNGVTITLDKGPNWYDQ